MGTKFEELSALEQEMFVIRSCSKQIAKLGDLTRQVKAAGYVYDSIAREKMRQEAVDERQTAIPGT